MELDVIKSQYYQQQITKGIRSVLRAQREIALEKIYNSSSTRCDKSTGNPALSRQRSGLLLQSLTNPQFICNPSGKGVIAEVTIPQYLRFLDMKRKGNYKIYNRPLYGILYGETIKSIKYEFRDWIRKHYSDKLKQMSQLI